MATPKSKPMIDASQIVVSNRTLLAALLDLSEQAKVTAERSARAEERSARAEERSARAEEMAAQALRTIGALLQDFHALAQRTDGRLKNLENAAE